MKVVIINGSPKDETSMTMQSVFYIQKVFPQHDLRILNLTRDIDEIQKSERRYSEIIDEIASSDALIWAFPVRVLLVPAQMKRFIELVFERKSEAAFRGKYTALVASSFHGADHLALNYMNAVCDDLGMIYTGFYSGDMEDLLKTHERKRLTLFAEGLFEAASSGRPMPRSFMPVTPGAFRYVPSAPFASRGKIDTGGRRITIITDTSDGQSNTVRMIERFRSQFTSPPEVVDLSRLEIRWCRGCLQCAWDGSCVHKGTDRYYRFFEDTIKATEMLVFAGSIQDRFLSSGWKVFFDRSFYNNHIPALTNKQVAFLVSGPLRQIPNLRQYMEVYSEWQRANLVDVITDEDEDAGVIDALLQSLASRMVRFAETEYVRTPTFLGIGLNKIVRDIVWGKMRFLARATHQHFTKSGFYDFPHRDYKTRIINAVMTKLMIIPAIRRRVYSSAMQLIVAPHRNLIAKAEASVQGSMREEAP